MSRCFPYPPPGFVKKGICDETLIESIKVLLSIVALWVFDFVLDVLCSIRFVIDGYFVIDLCDNENPERKRGKEPYELYCGN